MQRPRTVRPPFHSLWHLQLPFPTPTTRPSGVEARQWKAEVGARRIAIVREGEGWTHARDDSRGFSGTISRGRRCRRPKTFARVDAPRFLPDLFRSIYTYLSPPLLSSAPIYAATSLAAHVWPCTATACTFAVGCTTINVDHDTDRRVTEKSLTIRDLPSSLILAASSSRVTSRVRRGHGQRIGGTNATSD